MHRIFQRFIDHLASATGEEGFRDAMADAAGALDLSCFAYLATSNSPQIRLGSYNPPSNWTNYYLDLRYESVDPVIVQALVDIGLDLLGVGILAIVLAGHLLNSLPSE